MALKNILQLGIRHSKTYSRLENMYKQTLVTMCWTQMATYSRIQFFECHFLNVHGVKWIKFSLGNIRSFFLSHFNVYLTNSILTKDIIVFLHPFRIDMCVSMYSRTSYWTPTHMGIWLATMPKLGWLKVIHWAIHEDWQLINVSWNVKSLVPSVCLDM